MFCRLVCSKNDVLEHLEKKNKSSRAINNYIYILRVLKRRLVIIYDVHHTVPQSFSLYDSCHRHVRVYTFVMIILHFKRLREKILTESDDVQLRSNAAKKLYSMMRVMSIECSR